MQPFCRTTATFWIHVIHYVTQGGHCVWHSLWLDLMSDGQNCSFSGDFAYVLSKSKCQLLRVFVRCPYPCWSVKCLVRALIHLRWNEKILWRGRLACSNIMRGVIFILSFVWHLDVIFYYVTRIRMQKQMILGALTDSNRSLLAGFLKKVKL